MILIYHDENVTSLEYDNKYNRCTDISTQCIRVIIHTVLTRSCQHIRMSIEYTILTVLTDISVSGSLCHLSAKKSNIVLKNWFILTGFTFLNFKDTGTRK